MNYPSIRIEGAILSPDIIDRIEDLPGQRPADFGLDGTSKVKDEIARAWADAQDYWRIFQRKLESLRADSPATTETRQNWIIPLLGLLKYDIEFQKAGTEISGKNYAISHRVTNRALTPLHIVGYNDPAGLDKKPANATLRMSAHALVQQYLNLADELYGVVSNGRVIRLLRDSSRLVKQSYLEFDLDRIFEDGLFADFAILFRLLHATRLPAANDQATESLIEKFHQDSLDSGARIRDGLSAAVKSAILNLGNGFLSNPANEQLRAEVANGQLEPTAYYRQLLRLIYRLLFLMVIEERDLIFTPDVGKSKREIYREYYSVQRIRLMAEKRYLADKRHHDLWQALVSTFRLFEADGPGEKLGIKPLAGDLFSPRAIESFVFARLGNDILLNSLRSLGLYEHPDTRQLIRVNYGALNVEEFGSVYEGLLEYEAVFDLSSSTPQFTFVEGDERSRTGSHYTPDELVQPLIKHSLEYLIEERLKAADSETALLDLRVADIACGSGHILLAAARRIATEVAIVRTGEEQPSPPAYRKALRDVIRNCIFGVDLNPLAVELCKVALWLEAHNPGEPLGFLDHHIKCGNAIIGFVSREEVDNGVPDEAFARMPCDDADFVKAIRNKNKAERRERKQRSFNFTDERRGEIDKVLEKWRAITAMPERTPAEIESKKIAFEQFSTSGAAYTLEQLASMPIAQFFIPKTPENSAKLMTDGEFRDYWSGDRRPQGQSTAMSDAVANEKKFFHWFLEFPGVMERGGFDCILGNPPYLGNRGLSGTFGNAFLEWVKFEFAPAGAVDLVTYFLRRIFNLLKSGGSLAILSTNTIIQGVAREGGLDVIVQRGGVINFGIRSTRWPGTAAVSVTSLALRKGRYDGERWLDGKRVEFISTYLEPDAPDFPPAALVGNANKSFQGCIILGNGFILDEDESEDLITQNAENREVIFPYLNGDDLNSRPDLSAGRQVMNFFDWSEARCRELAPAVFALAEERVMPERTRLNDEGESVLAPPLSTKWWVYARRREKLYNAIRSYPTVLVTPRVSKYVSFAFVSSRQVFMDKLVVLASPKFETFSILQSNFHSNWAWRYSSTLGDSTINYAPSDCFDTFAFPCNVWDEEHESLAQIGQRYHDQRKQLMLTLWLGLTKIYNLFHDPDLSVEMVGDESGKDEDLAREGYEGLLELRRLHVEMDDGVRDAYGWQDLDLGHDFHEVETLPENDRTRYTISPTARKEVLNRLLALNHTRAAEEAARAAAAKPAKKSRKKAAAGDNPLLSGGPLFDGEM